MCLHSTYSGVGWDSYLHIKKKKKIQNLSTEKVKEKETIMTPQPLKPNPTYEAVG